MYQSYINESIDTIEAMWVDHNSELDDILIYIYPKSLNFCTLNFSRIALELSFRAQEDNSRNTNNIW